MKKALLQYSVFVLDTTVLPTLFDSNGVNVPLAFKGKDPENGENEIYSIELRSGIYWSVYPQFDGKTGAVLKTSLQRVTVEDGEITREGLGSLSPDSTFIDDLDMLKLEEDLGLPEIVTETLAAGIMPKGWLC